MAFALACTPRKAEEPSWPMFRNDVERSGFAEGSVVGKRVRRVWQIPSFNVTQYGQGVAVGGG
jgi:hypothetical protein